MAFSSEVFPAPFGPMIPTIRPAGKATDTSRNAPTPPKSTDKFCTSSRDVISRAEQTEIDEGRGIGGNVLLDLRHLGAEKILERLHGTRELSLVFAGVDPIYDPIPVRPGAHYHMGGVDTDVWGRTSVEGLYAVGDVVQGLAQISVAMGQAALAATAIHNSLPLVPDRSR